MAKEYVVPVYLTVEADSASEAREKVREALVSDDFEWPYPLAVLYSCLANEDEVYEDE